MIQRQNLSSSALITIGVLGIVLCLMIAAPFVPALTWALALAVAARPLHDWMTRRVTNPSVAAGLTVALLVIGLLVPAILIGQQVGREGKHGYETVRKMVESGEFENSLKQHPRVAEWIDWIVQNVTFEEEAKHAAQWIGGWFQGSMVAVGQIVVAQFFLFFMFRDRARAFQAFRALMPLSHKEADEVLGRVGAMVHATIFGNLVVGSIQGFLGGMMFWMLGIPAALLWACVMALMSLIPSLGSFLIWAPAALGFALQGNWLKAGILLAWGVLVVSTIDNILYPILVGKEIRIHPATVFIASLGGLIWMGAPGIVLGPATFAFTSAIIEVIRMRTVGSRSVEQPV